jgi:hypothetical protein
MLLVETLRFHQDPEIRYVITQAVARISLLPDLLRIDPLPRSAVWALALKHGFMVRDREEIVRIDAQILRVDELMGDELQPVSDWSAQRWGLSLHMASPKT